MLGIIIVDTPLFETFQITIKFFLEGNPWEYCHENTINFVKFIVQFYIKILNWSRENSAFIFRSLCSDKLSIYFEKKISEAATRGLQTWGLQLS